MWVGWVLLLAFSPAPLHASPFLTDWLSSKTNFWEQVATKVLNVTDFCLASGISATDLFSTCLLGVPSDLETFRELTPWAAMPNRPVSYQDMWKWRMTVPEKEPGMIAMKLAHILPAKQCFQISQCLGPVCEHLPRDNLLNCSRTTSVAPSAGYIKLPLGWFFICGKMAYSYLPAQSTLGTCALGKLALFMPSKRDVELAHTLHRRARSTQNLDPDCDPSVILAGVPKFVATAVFLPGVAAAMNYKAVKHLACALVKDINFTSHALASMASEMHELREAVLENRAAIDFLLLKHSLPCSSVQGMCCFNLSDRTASINRDIHGLKEIATNIKEEIGFDLSFLTDWLPSLDWLRKGFLVFLGALFLLLLLGCCGSCFLTLFRNCLQRFQPKPSEQMIMLPLEGYNVAVGAYRS